MRPFYVQSILDNPQAFEHHQSITKLWELKWRGPCEKGIYPFVHGKVEDFEPIFDTLAKQNVNLLDPDRYAAPFLSVGKRLVSEAEAASGDQARDLSLRASAVFRIARFPITRQESANNWEAWDEGKKAYLRGMQYFDSPVRETMIPFTQASSEDATAPIPAYVRTPTTSTKWPVVLFICGLDSYRTDQTETIDQHLADGFAVVCVEIPGTGDCPAARNDPKSPERLFESILDWIAAQSYLDSSRVIARGISTGGYYALRLAHTHSQRLMGAVAQGTWSHHTLSPEWLLKADNGEYPFGIAEGLAYKLGYNSVQAALDDDIQQRFSLLNNGILDQDSCPVLLVNGMEDSIFPIEDSILAASHGNPKTVRFVENAGHMGRPEGEPYINQWMVTMAQNARSVEHDPALIHKGDNLPSIGVYITGHDVTGKSVVQSRIPLQWNFTDKDRSPMAVAYTNKFLADLNNDADIKHLQEKMQSPMGLVSAHGVVLRYVDFAPGYTCMMHRTQSLDYGIVLEGQVECLFDSGETLLMKRGDVAIQRVTLHAWRNPSQTEWARMVYCLQDCKPLYINGKMASEDLGSGAGFLHASDNA